MAERQKAIESAEHHFEEEFEVIDSYFENAPVEARPLWYLGKSIELLSTADVAFFAKGWKESRGCIIEYICANKYGMTVFEE